MMLSRNFVKGLQVAKTSLRTYSHKGPVTNILKGINKVTLVGIAGRDAELKGSEADSVVNFPIATTIHVKMSDGNYKQMTNWHRISVFRPTLRDQVVNRVKKGNKVYVSGKLSYGEFVDKDNVTQSDCTVLADEVITISDTFPEMENKAKEEDMPF